jgi:hypothetical protein
MLPLRSTTDPQAKLIAHLNHFAACKMAISDHELQRLVTRLFEF